MEGGSCETSQKSKFSGYGAGLKSPDFDNTYKRKRLRRLRRSSGQGVFNACGVDLLQYEALESYLKLPRSENFEILQNLHLRL